MGYRALALQPTGPGETDTFRLKSLGCGPLPVELKDAVEDLRKKGAIVAWQDNRGVTGEPRRAFWFGVSFEPGSRFGDDDVPLLLRLPNLRVLSLHNTAVTRRGVDLLPLLALELEFVDLSGIRLPYAYISDLAKRLRPGYVYSDLSWQITESPVSGLSRLAATGKCRKLDIWCDLPDRALPLVGSLSELESLAIGGEVSTVGFLRELKQLRELCLAPASLTDAVVSSLASLPRLECLRLGLPNQQGRLSGPVRFPKTLGELHLTGAVSSHTLAFLLSELPWLRILEIETPMEGQFNGVELPPLDALEGLRIAGTDMADLAWVSSLHRLRHLNLYGCHGIDDDDLACLRDLEDLRTLCLAGTSISDMGAAALSSLTKLEALDVGYTDVSGRGLSQLPPMPGLKVLVVRGMSPPGPEFWAWLMRQPSLRRVDLSGMTFGEDSQELKRAQMLLGQCHLVSGP